MAPLSWDLTEADRMLVRKIVRRCLDERLFERVKSTTVEMDLAATHLNGCPLDFQKLLAAERFDLMHDIYGIATHLNRDTGQLMNCFVPRCASPGGAHD